MVKAHRRVYASALGSRVIKKKGKQGTADLKIDRTSAGFCPDIGFPLPAETKVESGTSHGKSGTSGHSSNGGKRIDQHPRILG